MNRIGLVSSSALRISPPRKRLTAGLSLPNKARSLFEESPASLWIEDFSVIKKLLDEVRDWGITDLRAFMETYPEFIERCIAEIKVIDINRYTLTLFDAPDKPSLQGRLSGIIRNDVLSEFTERLIDLWQGKLRQERELIVHTLKGEALNLVQQFSVMPNHEHNWSRVLFALTDITAQKKAETSLEYLRVCPRSICYFT
jgi:hypothetical protein